MSSDLKRKLSSRKFWAMVTAFIVGLLTAFNVDENTKVQITALIGSFSAIVIYIYGESKVDVANASSSTTSEIKNTIIKDDKMGDK